MRALACPASLKGVLTAHAAASALAEGLRSGGVETTELPVADGGEGTAEVLQLALGGRWLEADVHDAFGSPRRARWLVLPDGTAVVEAAAAIPFDPDRADPLAASSRGFGELLLAALEQDPRALLVCLGGTATMDAGAGLLELVRHVPVGTRAVCDVTATLAEAPRLFGPQKGAGPAEIRALECRFSGFPEVGCGGGAGGGLGAALASLGATLVRGAPFVLDAVGFDPFGLDLVVTGEGRVDATTALGKAPGWVAQRCATLGVPCTVFGGVVEVSVAGARTVALSGEPSRAREDLVALGRDLASGL